ncbi:hypothetical protein G9A89_009193 [Geosiphon pyriformis]|nr:hypothetical protein G9A89_009193 [Geosiphon pyriformis]
MPNFTFENQNNFTFIPTKRVNTCSFKEPIFNFSSTLKKRELLIFPAIATTIPPEIFTNICEHLSSEDLLSLTKVCRRFKEFLCSSSSSTQQIWRQARLRSLPFLKLPPPLTLDEKQYYVLSKSEMGCQFCKTSGGKIYWAFRARTCDSCLDIRTLSHDRLFIECNVPEDVLSSIPFVHRGPSRIFWTRDVTDSLKDYSSLHDDKKENWINKKRLLLNSIIEDIQRREQQALVDTLGARLDRLQGLLQEIHGHMLRDNPAVGHSFGISMPYTSRSLSPN